MRVEMIDGDHQPQKKARMSHAQRVHSMEKRFCQSICTPYPRFVNTEHVIYWFRRALRLHDNPSLLKALLGATTVRFIYVLDTEQLEDNMHKSYSRTRFLLECLRDLDSSLQHLGARLHVVKGQPCNVFSSLMQKWHTTHLVYEAEPEIHGSQRDYIITTKAMSMGVDVTVEHSHTLYDTDVIKRLRKNQGLSTFSQFLSAVREIEAPPYPVMALGSEHVGGANFPLDEDYQQTYAVPSFDDDKYGGTSWNKLPGGELAALIRLERHLLPKYSPAMKDDLVSRVNVPFSSSALALSPYLRFGCLSPRLLYWKLIELYTIIHKCSRPNFSLHGHLLWREFAYTLGAMHANLDRISGNNMCMPIPWDHDEKAVYKWAEGKTGYPFIDAIMVQLKREGWIHDICRYVSASFLTYGGLWQSWEEGLQVFAERLIDADYSTNSVTWLWSSCSSMLRQYPKPHDPVVVGKIMDPEGVYIRRYLPVLSRFPNRYIHKPSAASLQVQEECGCVIGKDYPVPIIDHNEVTVVNQERLKQVFRHIFMSCPQRSQSSFETMSPKSSVNSCGSRTDGSESDRSTIPPN